MLCHDLSIVKILQIWKYRVYQKKRCCSWVVFLDLLDNKDKDLEENANSDSDESGVPRVFTRQQILNSFTSLKIS